MNEVLARHPAMKKLRDEVIALSLLSHANASNYGGSSGPSSDEDIGGRRPPGSEEDRPNSNASRQEWMDWRASYQRRNVAYFQQEVAKCETAARLEELVEEAKAALAAWRATPIPDGQDPEYDSPRWKQWIGASTESVGSLARRYSCSRQKIILIQKQYGTEESRQARARRDPRTSVDLEQAA